jgi:hypothetical protein
LGAVRDGAIRGAPRTHEKIARVCLCGVVKGLGSMIVEGPLYILDQNFIEVPFLIPYGVGGAGRQWWHG